jgi:hypothetical protein
MQEPVGDEDLLGARVFVPEQDAWATVMFAEAGEMDEERDSDGVIFRSGGGYTYSLKLDGQRGEGSLTEDILEDLVREQHGTPIHEHDLASRKVTADDVIDMRGTVVREGDRVAADWPNAIGTVTSVSDPDGEYIDGHAVGIPQRVYIHWDVPLTNDLGQVWQDEDIAAEGWPTPVVEELRVIA